VIRTPWAPRIILGIAAALIIWAIVALSVGSGGPQRVTINGSDQVQQLLGGVRQDGRRLGNPDAPVTVTVFNDLQCAPCADYEINTVDSLVAQYARGDSVQFEFRHLSFGDAETTLGAGAAVAAAEQDREWQYLDLFFRNQDQIRSSRVTTSFLDNIANALPEFEVDEWQQNLGTQATDATVAEDAQLADSLHLPFNAPSVVVTGPSGSQKILQGSPPEADVQAAIAAAG
jgi:protein-disulfide isomerase